MKIALFGIGSIGSIISLNLPVEGTYFYFNRSPRNNINVNFKNKTYSKKLDLNKVDKNYEPDWLIICIKAYQFDEAKADLKKLVDKNTKVAVIRNGIDLKAPFLKFTTADKILECMIDCPVQKTNEGSYLQLAAPKIVVKKSALADEFEKLFIEGNLTVKQVDDFLTMNWKKIIESSAIGGILALSGETTWIFKDEKVVDLYKKIIIEGIAVAQKEGADIDNDFVEKLVQKLKTYPDTKGSSMLTDRRNGLPIELDAKNGIISKYGKQHEVNTDINDMICILLKHTNNKK